MEPIKTELAESLYALGYSKLEAQHWNAALEVFRAMVLLLPQDERSWLGLGRAHEELDQHETAIELYSFCLLTVPRAVIARRALARALDSVGRSEHVAEILERAKELEEEAA